MENPVLARLALAGQVRQGMGQSLPSRPAVSSAHPALDALLGGGWPLGVLIELLVTPPGSAELALLLPALVRLQAAEPGRACQVVLLAPPHMPYAPALQQQGLDLQRLLVVPPTRRRQPADLLWAMEEALAAGACAAVVAWGDAAGRTALQRLQLAALGSDALAVLVRRPLFRRERSPAAVRLEVHTTAAAGLGIEVFRNRQGAVGRIELSPA
ncbi:MAG: translesion DNA synthesis-associated protein ImuA [Chromatiales bacterium]|nr:translesion DNA synthesis-associated protein ImuA [Chromatiales bacterium]